MASKSYIDIEGNTVDAFSVGGNEILYSYGSGGRIVYIGPIWDPAVRPSLSTIDRWSADADDAEAF